MKELKELKLEEMSIKQKVGFVMTALIADPWPVEKIKENLAFVHKLIREQALGAVWVNHVVCKDYLNIIQEIREIADYPILIITDAESGLGDYKIAKHNAIGMADSEDLAYTFGKTTAVTAKKWGYNVVCDPVVDMIDHSGICGANVRAMGSDKEKVAKLAKAIVRGMHDGGVMSIAKHYPSPSKKNVDGKLIDSHMAETSSTMTKEELLDYSLYPYLEMMKEDLLDGIMVGHCKLSNIDPDFPASLSKKVIDIIRDEGFHGITITDALSMMGVVAKFGEEAPCSLSVAAGNDLALPWKLNNEAVYNVMLKGYEEGIFTETDLDKAVARILNAQHKVYELSKIEAEITEKDIENYNKIAPKSIFAKTDEGMSVALDKNGKYCFFVLTDIAIELNDKGTVDVDTFTGGWYSPHAIIKKLEESYPNSKAYAISQFPLGWRISKALSDSLDHEVVFITYQDAQAYVGKECLSSRIISLMDAMQVSNRISTIVHFGNPYVLEDLPHIPRVIVGGASAKCIDVAFEVMAGNTVAEGVLTYDVKIN